MAVLDRVRIDEKRVASRARDDWYFGIPAIASVRSHGLDFDPRVTIVVGENGTGKSTFIEAVAAAWRSKLSAANNYWGPGPKPEDADLHWVLQLEGDRPISHGGCFLRAEAMHEMFGHTTSDSAAHRLFAGALNARSHGEGFLDFLQSRLSERGLFVFDEPEAALSFSSCLQLLSLMDAIVAAGSQVLLATHSPVLAAFPGATILEFSDGGITPRDWEDLEFVQHWRTFMAAPQSYLRHLFT
jgi:predicted ATPase